MWDNEDEGTHCKYLKCLKKLCWFRRKKDIKFFQNTVEQIKALIATNSLHCWEANIDNGEEKRHGLMTREESRER